MGTIQPLAGFGLRHSSPALESPREENENHGSRRQLLLSAAVHGAPRDLRPPLAAARDPGLCLPPVSDHRHQYGGRMRAHVRAQKTRGTGRAFSSMAWGDGRQAAAGSAATPPLRRPPSGRGAGRRSGEGAQRVSESLAHAIQPDSVRCYHAARRLLTHSIRPATDGEHGR